MKPKRVSRNTTFSGRNTGVLGPKTIQEGNKQLDVFNLFSLKGTLAANEIT
jgi:hypothetical protein